MGVSDLSPEAYLYVRDADKDLNYARMVWELTLNIIGYMQRKGFLDFWSFYLISYEFQSRCSIFLKPCVWLCFFWRS